MGRALSRDVKTVIFKVAEYFKKRKVDRESFPIIKYHVQKNENDYWNRDFRFDNIIDSFITNLQDSDSSSNGDTDDEDDDKMEDEVETESMSE